MHGASHAKARVMWLGSKFGSASDRHRGSFLLVGFKSKRGVREKLL